jgi:hypothetical protein
MVGIRIPFWRTEEVEENGLKVDVIKITAHFNPLIFHGNGINY